MDQTTQPQPSPVSGNSSRNNILFQDECWYWPDKRTGFHIQPVAFQGIVTVTPGQLSLVDKATQQEVRRFPLTPVIEMRGGYAFAMLGGQKIKTSEQRKFSFPFADPKVMVRRTMVPGIGGAIAMIVGSLIIDPIFNKMKKKDPNDPLEIGKEKAALFAKAVFQASGQNKPENN